MNKRRIALLEAEAWRCIERQFDAMTTDEILAWMDEHYGAGAAEWTMTYLDTCAPAELEALAAPPGVTNPAKRRFHEAYQRWYEAQP